MSHAPVVFYPPKLALFWFVPDEPAGSRLVCVRWSFDISEPHEPKRPPCRHEDVWPDVVWLDHSLNGYRFDFFPRGHLEFYPPTRRWLLSIDEQLARGDFVDCLTECWLLPKGHLTVIESPDYRSAIIIPSPYSPPSAHFVVDR